MRLKDIREDRNITLKNLSEYLNINSALSELKELSEKALEENKWMIHFGL